VLSSCLAALVRMIVVNIIANLYCVMETNQDRMHCFGVGAGALPLFEKMCSEYH
jgi:hypothetical protein